MLREFATDSAKSSASTQECEEVRRAEDNRGQGEELVEQHTTRSAVAAPPTDLRENQEALHALVEKLATGPGAGRYVGRDAGRKNRPDILAARRRSVARRRCVREREAFHVGADVLNHALSDDDQPPALSSHESAGAIAATAKRGQRTSTVESANARRRPRHHGRRRR